MEGGDGVFWISFLNPGNWDSCSRAGADPVSCSGKTAWAAGGLTLHCWNYTLVLGQVGLDRSGKHLPPILLSCFPPVLQPGGI